MSKRSEEKIDLRNMPPGTKAWLYLRTFPINANRLYSPEEGIHDAIQKLIREKGWIVDRVFRDSVDVVDRAGFKEMIRLARQEPRAADVIIIWSGIHFTRSQEQLILYTKYLKRHGWRLFSMKSGYIDRFLDPWEAPDYWLAKHLDLATDVRREDQ